jgi:hypothetical protein
MLYESTHDKLIDDIQNQLDFSYGAWDPPIKVWRAGEGFKREFPYVAIDFIATSLKRFPSLADVVGRIDDIYFTYAYCELELCTITVFTRKYHNNNLVRGRSYAVILADRIRKRILAFWNDILKDNKASIDRSRAMPVRDLTNYRADTGDRVHEYDINIFIRTDVRWSRMPSTYEVEEVLVDEARGEMIANESTPQRFRVIYNG